MTVVQISDYRSLKKTPLRTRRCPRVGFIGIIGDLASNLQIACGVILAWVVVFIVVASVGAYVG